MDLDVIVSKIPSVSEFAHLNVGPAERVASVFAGAALAVYGISRGSLKGYGAVAAGGALLFRGITGYCPVNAAVGRDTTTADRPAPRVEVRTSLTVEKPRTEVYAYWRRLENLPHFMKHVASVRELDERRSVWSAPIPKTGAQLDWEAEIEAEEENERISWRSIGGAAVDNAGEVTFEDGPGSRGTVLHVRISYAPPAGEAGAVAARLLNPAFEQMVTEDVRRFKHVIEAGEVPTTTGQPEGS